MNTRALALRDSGQYEKALALFGDLRGKDPFNPIYLGNYARCLIKLGDYKAAESLLCQCLKMLLEKHDFMSRSNLGYAYEWISDVMIAQNRLSEAAAFILLAERIWKELSPNLIFKINDKIKYLSEQAVAYDQATIIEANFLNESA